MKKIMICAFVLFLTAGSSFAMDQSGHSMGDMVQTSQKMTAAQSEQEGEFVHSAIVDGYTLNFYLIDMKKKMAEINASAKNKIAMNMGSMKSHHLMLNILDPDGKKISDARVGYMVTAPDGVKQKTMTMGMSGGYGADVDLRTGTYKIMTKALVKNRKIINTFDLRVRSTISSQR